MGNVQAWQRSVTDPPGINPGANATPTFDPMFGFKDGRKERGTFSDIISYFVMGWSMSPVTGIHLAGLCEIVMSYLSLL